MLSLLYTCLVLLDMPAEFTVFCQKAGAKCSPTDVEVDCIDETGNKVECHVTDNGNNTFKVIYFPKLANKHKIYVRFQGEEIPESPITVPVQPFCDPTKVKANGPGLSGEHTILVQGFSPKMPLGITLVN